MELKSLSDFQKLEGVALSSSDKQRLISSSEFYQAPKANDVIRRQHALMVDKILGYRVRYIEEMLIADARGFDPDGSHETWGPTMHNGVQTWVGLELQTLQTPYSEIYRILHLLRLKPYQHVVDLGAAYGRMGVVINGLFIKNTFTGYEFVRARVDEGNRIYKDLNLIKSKLITADLSAPDFDLPEADVYFIYDYGQVEHIERTLKQIRAVSEKRPVKIVVRGKFTRRIIAERHEWMGLSYEGKLEELFSIYVAYKGH
jgi:hypothetical protein